MDGLYNKVKPNADADVDVDTDANATDNNMDGVMSATDKYLNTVKETSEGKRVSIIINSLSNQTIKDIYKTVKNY